MGRKTHLNNPSSSNQTHPQRMPGCCPCFLVSKKNQKEKTTLLINHHHSAGGGSGGVQPSKRVPPPMTPSPRSRLGPCHEALRCPKALRCPGGTQQLAQVLDAWIEPGVSGRNPPPPRPHPPPNKKEGNGKCKRGTRESSELVEGSNDRHQHGNEHFGQASYWPSESHRVERFSH